MINMIKKNNRVFDRLQQYTIFKKDSMKFVIEYAKNTPMFQFQVDCFKTDKVEYKIRMFRNLDRCEFVRKYINIRTKRTEKIDYVERFDGFKNVDISNLKLTIKEKTLLNCNSGKDYLYVLGWRDINKPNNNIFILVQRRFFSNKTKQHVIRTSGISIEKYDKKDIS